ncbi:MAG: hypothetical protein HDR90_01525 [Bacteroides sp.]|nr:hypothetical protein [Bacteroides sp.]
MKSYILTLAAAAMACTAAAQGLHQEVEVEREITPTESEATRYNLLPQVILPSVTPVTLTLSDRAVTAPVRPAFSHLSPVASNKGIDSDSYPGYFRAGIFPLFNADASAGYRFLNTDRTRLSAWLQYTGHVYRRDLPASEGDRRYWRDHSVAGGADLHQAVGRSGIIDAGAAYAYDRYNLYNYSVPAASYSTFPQWVHRFNADAVYSVGSEAFAFRAGLHFDRFSFGLRNFVPAREHVYRLNLGANIATGDRSRFSLALDGVLIHNSVHRDATSRGLIKLRPVYEFFNGESKFTGHIGVNASASVNDGSVFSIAPDVMLGWNPSSYFGLELRATGGAVANTLAQLYEQSPYMYSGRGYGHSEVPYDLQATVMIGPARGAYIKVTGGYARATDWLMPDVALAPEGHGVAYRPCTIRGWNYKATLGWKHRYFLIEGSYAMAPSSLKGGFYQWRDRARRVVDAKIEIYPVKKLTIEAGFQLRQGRAIYNFTGGEAQRLALGNAASLSAGITYEVTRTLTLWASGDNLLNYSYVYLGGRPAQGATGLVGVALKF